MQEGQVTNRPIHCMQGKLCGNQLGDAHKRKMPRHHMVNTTQRRMINDHIDRMKVYIHAIL